MQIQIHDDARHRSSYTGKESWQNMIVVGGGEILITFPCMFWIVSVHSKTWNGRNDCRLAICNVHIPSKLRVPRTTDVVLHLVNQQASHALRKMLINKQHQFKHQNKRNKLCPQWFFNCTDRANRWCRMVSTWWTLRWRHENRTRTLIVVAWMEFIHSHVRPLFFFILLLSHIELPIVAACGIKWNGWK